MLYVSFLSIGLIIGSATAWIICRLYNLNKFVPKPDFLTLSQQFNDISIAKAVAESALTVLKEEKTNLVHDRDAKSKELQDSCNRLTETTTIKNSLEETTGLQKKQLTELNTLLQSKETKLSNALQTITELNAELNYGIEKLKHQEKEIEHIGTKFETQFKLLANAILDEKSQKFTEQQESNLKNILDPLKEHIRLFKQEFESKFNKESEERISLTSQVKLMVELNSTLSEQANNLTKALNGNVKQQGNWGEMILESILQYSGLQKNIHYFVQERSATEEGDKIQPDVLINYPDNRRIVVDSKVSLFHYEKLCTSDAEPATHLEELVCSFKSHIDGLASKRYDNIANAWDNIIMFVPVEGAYIAAINAEPQLWQYAHKRGILLISSSNLILALKLIKDMWQKHAIDQNAQEIARRAGRLYDKLAGFIDTFEKVGAHVEKALGSWQDAKKQLKSGKGNIISQAEQMKGLEIKSTKKIPSAIVEDGLLEDGFSLEDGKDIIETQFKKVTSPENIV